MTNEDESITFTEAMNGVIIRERMRLSSDDASTTMGGFNFVAVTKEKATEMFKEWLDKHEWLIE